MGIPDSAQVSDLVGIYIPYELEDQFPYIFSGLCLNYCLLYLQNISKQNLQNVKPDLFKFFSNIDLSISFHDNRTKANFLDLALNLNSALYFPCHKPSTNLKYISVFSNYHRNISRNISVRIPK